MNVLARLLGFFLSILGFSTRLGRPAYPVHQEFVQGQLSAGTIYRLLRDARNERATA